MGVAAGRKFYAETNYLWDLFCFCLICYFAWKTLSFWLLDWDPAVGVGRGVSVEEDWQELQKGVWRVWAEGFWQLLLAANPECMIALTKEVSAVGATLKKAWTNLSIWAVRGSFTVVGVCVHTHCVLLCV